MVTTLRDDLDRLSNAAESALNQAIQASAPLANLAALDEEQRQAETNLAEMAMKVREAERDSKAAAASS